jgi:predicted unusual protein kinase regulating ubiquinone biosynthesis (AarF/ABC1/UbiB family)
VHVPLLHLHLSRASSVFFYSSFFPRRVHVPLLYPRLSSARVLTMEYIDGVPITDAAGLRHLGVSPAALSRLISRTFNRMVFVFGDVHADPHAANLLVRRQVRLHGCSCL